MPNKTVCGTHRCTGCGACTMDCPKKAITMIKGLSYIQAVIDEGLCINCGRCYRVCPIVHKPTFIPPKSSFQGWSNDKEIRRHSSSGGLASSIMSACLIRGFSVFTCTNFSDHFRFAKVDGLNAIQEFSGSKYVKSNAAVVFNQIREELNVQHDVLFIGLPCQVASLQNYVGSLHLEHLYTIDLVCHGTPNIELLEKYLSEQGLLNSGDLVFRRKGQFGVSPKKSETSIGYADAYSLAFLDSLSYTENCYQCPFARLERVSDITLGDAWTTEYDDEKRLGVSLVLSMTTKGDELLRISDVKMLPIDLQREAKTNHQLNHPSIPHKNYHKFFRLLGKGKSFEGAVKACLPWRYFKQRIKRLLSHPDRSK